MNNCTYIRTCPHPNTLCPTRHSTTRADDRPTILVQGRLEHATQQQTVDANIRLYDRNILTIPQNSENAFQLPHEASKTWKYLLQPVPEKMRLEMLIGMQNKRKARQNGENVNPFGAWPPWLATGAGHGLDGSAPHQYR